MISRNEIIRQADAAGVPAPTVERDYILSHVLAAIAARDEAEQLVFKGGTSLRLCYFEDYRYSADLDFSLVDGIDKTAALNRVVLALSDCENSIQLQGLELNDATPPRIEYTGPLGKRRTLKLDLADDELVEETTRRRLFIRYSDQRASDCIVYTLEETAAEKLRCVIQRLQCRDLYDLHELLVVRELDPSFIWPSFERKARHRGIDPSLFAERFEERARQYEARWSSELSEHVSGEPSAFDMTLRTTRRALRKVLRDD